MDQGPRRSDVHIVGRENELAVLRASLAGVDRKLFVTVYTVEAHLSHGYAKLGVRSRVQLARHFARRV